jgi:NADH-quinone oxidoreductase subunit N
VNGTDLQSILPLLVLGGTAVVLMLAIAVHRSHVLTATLAALGLLATLLSVPFAAAEAPRQVTELVIVDAFGLFYVTLLAAGALATVVLAYAYLREQDEQREEFYVLVLLATLGSAVLAESSHLASFFLGLETLSVSLYGLVAYTRSRAVSIEAGIKYLILAAASSAFLLFGMALLYADSGTMQLALLATAFSTGAGSLPFLLVGIALILVGSGFKLAAAPFHLWTPDVYQGAPAPVTGFIATVSKGGMLALLLRLFTELGWRQYEPLVVVIVLMAIASMFLGNLLALFQTSVKRILAYSSIAHMGYMLVAFLAAGRLGVEAVTFYLVAYFVTTLGAFGVVAALSDGAGDRDALSDYRGLAWRRPWLAALLSACLFSLAGIPLTAGFIGKYTIILAAASVALWVILALLAINSIISIYYYLRVIIAVYGARGEGAEEEAARPLSVSVAGGLMLTGIAVLLFWIGIYPSPFLDLVTTATKALFP